MVDIAPYGTWPSPITTDLLVSQSISLGGATIRPEGLYWLEGRPTEAGRLVLVHEPNGGTPVDLTPAPFNARSRVHEYGGGAWLVDDAGIFFVNFADQQVYRLEDGNPVPVTHAPDRRFADMVVDSRRNRLIAVAETHSDDAAEPVNSIVAISLDDGDIETLIEGHDFFAAPRLDPAGEQLAWLSWDHPNMPWDGTELHLGTLASDGRLADVSTIAGDAATSVQQPTFSPSGRLCFVSDVSGWWNLFAWDAGTAKPLCPAAAEFGGPQWALGLRTWCFRSDREIACVINTANTDRIALLDVETGQLTELSIDVNSVGSVAADATRLVYTGANALSFPALCSRNWSDGATRQVRTTTDLTFDAGTLSAPEAISFATGNGETAHGFYYAPANAACNAPAGELPPLLVTTHGGPTAAAHGSLSLAIQFWTSRGIAVLDVNYRGSTGYGRAYRDSLKLSWGVKDVEDAAAGARHLADAGLVDAERLIIRGGSAGGYTTLAALAFTDTFRAGASLYGIGNLEALARDTHKFESRYLDTLIGPYPESRERYVERSPIHHLDGLDCPTIFLQGLEDRIVPPNQAEAMVEALERKGIPVAYVPFEGEQHGFRQAANIKRALDAELYFYGRVFGFEPADSIEPVPISNLPSPG